MSGERPALTTLSEDEIAFRDAVREFAEGEIKPLVSKMDEEGQLDTALMPKLFEMGLDHCHISYASIS